MTTDNTIVQERAAPLPGKAGADLPEFDPSKYMAELDGLDITEAQRIELLGVIWSIMASFVQLGFDVKICGSIFLPYIFADAAESGAVDSSPSTKTEKRTPKRRRKSP